VNEKVPEGPGSRQLVAPQAIVSIDLKDLIVCFSALLTFVYTNIGGRSRTLAHARFRQGIPPTLRDSESVMNSALWAEFETSDVSVMSKRRTVKCRRINRVNPILLLSNGVLESKCLSNVPHRPRRSLSAYPLSKAVPPD
jgi:hypothetical protein